MTDKKTFFPIDIVYLWVDGCDKKFNSIKNKYLKESNKNIDKYVDDVRDEIYCENNELKFLSHPFDAASYLVDYYFPPKL